MVQKIGVTGIFGSGKSEVANCFKSLGASVVDADQLAHEALRPGSKVFQQIAVIFSDCLNVSGEFDRKKIAKVIFQDTGKRKQLEAIIHPYVFERMQEESLKSTSEVVILELPLLFETGADRFCDFTLVVHAPEAVIRERLIAKGFSEEEIKLRTKAQMPLEEKIKLADFAIDNGNSAELTKKSVKQIWDQLAQFKGEKKKNG